MAWDDAPPTKEELAAPDWTKEPPRPEELPPSKQPGDSSVNAATGGFLQGASLNLAPRLSAATSAGMNALTGVTGPLAGGSLSDIKKDYDRYHDELEKEMHAASAKHPYISLAANMAGAGAPIGALGKAAMTAPGLLGTGAVAGGASSSDLTDIPQTVGKAALGAGTNLGAGKAVEAVAPYLNSGASKIGEGLNSAGEFLGEKAEKSAVKSLSPIKSQMQNLLMKGQVTGEGSLGRTLLDTPGAMTPFASLASKQEAMQGLQQSSGEAIGNTLTQLDQMGAQAPSPGDLAQEVQTQSLPLKDLKTAQPTYNALQDVGSDIQTIGAKSSETGVVPGPFQQVQDIKSFVNDQVNKTGGWQGPNPSEKNLALRDVYSMISDKLEKGAQFAAESSGNPDLLKNYLKSKSDYSNAIAAGKILNKSTAAEAANNRIGLGSTIMGAGELASGNVAKAAVTTGAWEAGKRYGNNIGAIAADKISQLLKTAPQRFGDFAQPLLEAAKRGPVALGATDYILQQNNPKYQEARDTALNGGDEQ